MGFGLLELLLIAGGILLFLGPSKIPQLAKSIKESREILKEDKEKEDSENNESDKEDGAAANES